MFAVNDGVVSTTECTVVVDFTDVGGSNTVVVEVAEFWIEVVVS